MKTKLDCVQFDVSGCKLREESDVHRMWLDDAGVYYCLRVNPDTPVWSFDPHDPVAASAFFAQQCAENKGVMLAMDTVKIGKVTGLRGLFKYRSPVPQSLAMMFVHILWIVFQDWSIQINVESVEIGTTGVREAVIMAMEGDNWPMQVQNAEPIMLENIDDLFAASAAQPLRSLPSDDEKYDKMFPDHPLSKVRQRMPDVLSTLQISASPKELKPYRKAPEWKFW